VVELLSGLHISADEQFMVRSMHLYCWPHNAVHAFPVADIERIVYALGVEIVHQRDAERVPPESPADFGTQCPIEALRWAGDGYADHVEQSIECREAGVFVPHLDGDVVDAEIDYREWYTRAAEQRAAALAIHRPCHTADTEPYGCQHGHQGFDEDTGSISGVPDQPAECMACTYDDRTYVWPCPTAQALGVTA